MAKRSDCPCPECIIGQPDAMMLGCRHVSCGACDDEHPGICTVCDPRPEPGKQEALAYLVGSYFGDGEIEFALKQADPAKYLAASARQGCRGWGGPHGWRVGTGAAYMKSRSGQIGIITPQAHKRGTLAPILTIAPEKLARLTLAQRGAYVPIAEGVRQLVLI